MCGSYFVVDVKDMLVHMGWCNKKVMLDHKGMSKNGDWLSNGCDFV